MATVSHDLPEGVWTEVTAPLAMDDGSSYEVEVVGGTTEAFHTDSNAAPGADARGHPLFPGTHQRPADYRTFSKVAGRFWWMRPAGRGVSVVATETG
ncbi:MAG: hypothetical protein F4X35_05145 [Alphaproteobacteria bacterium]|nr:hypothetical protein [Alphaproteobacteria bacterium]